MSFSQLTGSELYFYDLACGLRRLRCDVTILSDFTKGDLWKRAEKRGIKCRPFTHAPSEKFDVIIASHRTVIAAFISNKLYDGTPIIQICHSEIIPEELPIVHERVKHYVAIRPAIAKLMEDKYYIDSLQISLIWNPINAERLLSVKKQTPSEMTVLFPATIDYLRQAAMLSLYEKAKLENFKIIVVGRKYMDYLDGLDSSVIEVHEPTDNIGKYYAKATHVASIMRGRTCIEGWHFGLPCFEYTVDSLGVVEGMELVYPPSDLSIFDYKKVSKKVKDLCQSVLEK